MLYSKTCTSQYSVTRGFLTAVECNKFIITWAAWRCSRRSLDPFLAGDETPLPFPPPRHLWYFGLVAYGELSLAHSAPRPEPSNISFGYGSLIVHHSCLGLVTPLHCEDDSICDCFTHVACEMHVSLRCLQVVKNIPLHYVVITFVDITVS